MYHVNSHNLSLICSQQRLYLDHFTYHPLLSGCSLLCIFDLSYNQHIDDDDDDNGADNHDYNNDYANQCTFIHLFLIVYIVQYVPSTSTLSGPAKEARPLMTVTLLFPTIVVNSL